MLTYPFPQRKGLSGWLPSAAANRSLRNSLHAQSPGKRAHPEKSGGTGQKGAFCSLILSRELPGLRENEKFRWKTWGKHSFPPKMPEMRKIFSTNQQGMTLWICFLLFCHETDRKNPSCFIIKTGRKKIPEGKGTVRQSARLLLQPCGLSETFSDMLQGLAAGLHR